MRLVAKNEKALPEKLHDPKCLRADNHPGCVIVSSDPSGDSWEFRCPKCDIYWLEDKS